MQQWSEQMTRVGVEVRIGPKTDRLTYSVSFSFVRGTWWGVLGGVKLGGIRRAGGCKSLMQALRCTSPHLCTSSLLRIGFWRVVGAHSP